MAATIEESDFTSAKKRLETLLLRTAVAEQEDGQRAVGISNSPDRSLAPLHIDERSDELGPCPNRDGADLGPAPSGRAESPSIERVMVYLRSPNSRRT